MLSGFIIRNRKNLIIVGGSQAHVPFIQAAQNLGFNTIVFDINENSKGVNIADSFFKISTHDIDQIISKCCEINDENNLKGVMTYSSSTEPLYAVAKTCEVLGLPSFSLNSVELATNKLLMKECFVNCGIPTPAWIVTNKITEAIDFVNESKDQIIIKPSTGSQGSKGIAMVNHGDETLEYFETASRNSQDSKVILEKYIKGREFSVDGIVRSGNPVILSVSEKFNSGPELNFTMSGFSMGKIEQNEKELLKSIAATRETAIKTVVAMGISNSFFSIDILMTDLGPLVLECGILLDCKIDRLLKLASINVYDMYLDVITGKNTDIEGPEYSHGYGLSFMFADKKGKLVQTQQNLLKSNITVEWERYNGDQVTTPSSIADTLGWVIGIDSDSKAAYKHACQVAGSGLFQVST